MRYKYLHHWTGPFGLCFLTSLFDLINISEGQPLCEDFLMLDVCEAYSRWGWCHLYEAQLSCRLTCRACGPGWSSWSAFSQCSSTCNGQQSRNRQCRSAPVDCSGNDVETQQCNTACAIPAGAGGGAGGTGGGAGGTGGGSSGAGLGPTGTTVASLTCNATHFLCQSSPLRTCLKLELVCDGFNDCPDSSDEEPSNCFVSANSDSAFEIRNERYQVCMEVITDDPAGPINGVRAYRRCPSKLNPVRPRFLWHWWGSFHLMNLFTGRCLEAQNPTSSTYPKLTSMPCNIAQTNQKFVCDDHGTGFLFVKLRDAYEGFVNRYFSLGPSNSGWPVILEVNDTNFNKLWQRGPQEPPETICGHFQVYWGDWGSWTPCSSTCLGGLRSHVRKCINGLEGVPPCTGNTRETGPCNSKIACKPKGIGTPNSYCVNPPWIQLNNSFRYQTEAQLDPACFQLVSEPPLTYDRAKESCRRRGGFLATMKEEGGQTLLRQLVNSVATTERVYIGIEEDLFEPPVQGHHLRYDMDGTPVGDFQPWKVDCMVGPGYGYSGQTSATSSGLACQAWNVNNLPHKVEFVPVGDTDHSMCRNPNFDPKGPWCYSISGDLERDHCDIPQCTEVITSSDPILSADSAFYLGHECGFISRSEGTLYQLMSTAHTTTQFGGCSSLPSWEGADAAFKFAWDTSRTRIVNIKQMKCLEASSSEPDAQITLQTCDAKKVTQRWKSNGKRLLLSYSDFHADLQLDVSTDSRRAVVAASEYSSWTASRSSGHFVDLATLRDLSADDSFLLYNDEEKKCLGVNVTGPDSDLKATSELKFRVPLVLLECRYASGLRWSRYLSTKELFYNLHTSLCLSPLGYESGAEVMLLPCSTLARDAKWRCHDDFRISSQQQRNLYLTASEDGAVRPQVDGGFGKPKKRKSVIFKTDDTGNVFSRECLKLGSGSTDDEIWRFTESPTMLMHYATRRCLAVRSIGPGVPVFSINCDVNDNKQHWSLVLRRTNLLDLSNTVPFYSLHIAMDARYMMSIHGGTGRIVLRESLRDNWIAINKFLLPASVKTQADCLVGNATFNFYRGEVSTTKSGKMCALWKNSVMERSLDMYPELVENQCRNPGDSGRKPWCFIEQQGRLFEEECLIPDCPIAKVAMNDKGTWELVDGKERLSYICQAEPECFRGIGLDYLGTGTLTPLGRCVLWTNHVADTERLRNYCRNPDNSPGGPWCYVDTAVTTRSYCAIKECHPTCDSIPERLPHSETVYHAFSATTRGVEAGSAAVSQCHRGYWLSKDSSRTEMECEEGFWVPEPAPCIAVTCGQITVTIAGADLTSSSKLYGHHSLFTCKSGTLAGPGKPSIKYRCNEFGEWEPEENQLEECSQTCDDGWIPFRAYCYQTQNDKVNYDDAKSGCETKEALMADIDDKHEFDFLKNLLLTEGKAVHGKDTLYWVGIRHHQKTPRATDPQWRDYRSENTLNRFDVAEKKGANYLPFLDVDFFIMHYMHNRFTKQFDEILAYNERCMYVDAKSFFVASRGCHDYPRRKMVWKWVSPYHLYNIATGKCLTGFPVNGYTKEDLRSSAFVEKCDVNNALQFVGCRRHGSQSSLKLLFQENSYFVDDVSEPWDKVQIGGGYFAGNYSRWVLNSSDYDVCHHSITFTGNAFLLWDGKVANGDSYSYAEAQAKCRENAAELATHQQLVDKLEKDDISSCACAWVDGNAAYSVMGYKDPLCQSSAPRGGVKVCSPTPSRADAWCFKGEPRSLIDIPWAVAIWLDNATREGVLERDSALSAKYICKREMRWHCPPPPDIFRATLKESMNTLYSYLGTSAYECDPGYWFGRGIFIQEILCTSDLEWSPRPETLFCFLVDCPPPPDIAFAKKTVHGLLFREITTYWCELGYWFGKNRFTLDAVCSGYATWHPPIATIRCVPIKCDPPPDIEFAALETYSFEYKQNVTYHCKLGYWFGYQQYSLTATCDKHGNWQPDPERKLCWEIVCPPPYDWGHTVWEHIGRRTTVMSCEEGYKLKFSGESSVTPKLTNTSMTLECKHSGRWEPDSKDYKCVEMQCELPGHVPNTDNNIQHNIGPYGPTRKIVYHCHPGRYLQYIFTPYVLAYELCLFEETNGRVYASAAACGTPKMLHLHWERYNGGNNPMKLVDATTRRCLAAIELPTLGAPYVALTFESCNVTSARNQWLCSMHSVSDLILYLNSTSEFYLAADMDSGLVHTTSNKHQGLEFIDYNDRSEEVELDLCRFQEPHFSQTVSCLKNGTWNPNPTLIDCIPVHCGQPPAIPNADIESDFLNVGYAATAEYTCDPGYEYLKGRNFYVSRCSDMQTWIPNPLELPCQEIECPHYSVPPGAIVKRGNIKNNKFNTKLIIGCPVGFFFASGVLDITVTCGATMQWEGDRFSECLPINCGDPPVVANASATAVGGNLFNTLARYVCDAGFWMKPGLKWKDTYCSDRGLWEPDPSEFSCYIVKCSDPGLIPDSVREDASRASSDYLFGAVVLYKCNKGRWFAKGLHKVSVTCRDDAMWYPHPATLYCKLIRCDKPSPIPRHSFIVGLDYSYQSTVRVVCGRGYRMGGHDLGLTNSTELVCTYHNKWDPDPFGLICLRLSCGEPPLIPDTYLIESDNLYESYTQYFCRVGYWIHIGVSSILTQCDHHGNWNPDPSSVRCVVVECGHPGLFPNAMAVRATDGMEYGNMAVVECKEGYWIERLFERQTLVRCSDEGLWEPLSENIRCIGVKCSSPPEIKLATRTLLSPAVFDDVVTLDPITGKQFYDFGVQMKYTCENNTEFDRRQQTIIASCMKNGNWSVDWHHLNCTVTTCTPPNAIMHGYLTKNDAISRESYQVGFTVRYSCDVGYWFDKDVYAKTATCQRSGLWDMDVESLTCIRVTCDQPEPLENAHFVLSGLSHPHSVRYSCLIGYRLNSSAVSVCSETGEWDPPVKSRSCEVVFCPADVNIPHSALLQTPTSTEFGISVDFECLQDFYLAAGVNRFTITCDAHGEWIGAEARCLRYDQFECQMPPFVANAYYVTNSSRVVTLRCQRGFFMRSNTTMIFEQLYGCMINGTWLPGPAQCEEGYCPDPVIKGAHTLSVLSVDLNRYTVGTVINIQCLGGAVKISPSRGPTKYKRWINITCGGKLEWEPKPDDVECVLVNCGTPPAIPNTTLTYSLTTLFSTARYLCTRLTSFGDRAIRHLTCHEDGTWKPDDWKTWRCSVKRCKLPAPPELSVMSSEGYDYLGVGEAADSYQFLRVTCQAGYKVAGKDDIFSQQYRCNRAGEWWPRNPGGVTCEPVMCGPIPNLTLTPLLVGGIPVNVMGQYPYGFVLTYMCPLGKWFAPENVTKQTIRCQWNGTWEPAPKFSCVAVTCDYPPTLDHSSLRGQGLHIGARWVYSCDYGYRMWVGSYSHATFCQGTGVWNPDPEALRCKVIACSVPPLLPYVVNNGSLRQMLPEQAYLAFREGSIYAYSCVPGYWISDGPNKQTSGNITCTAGEWTPHPQAAIRCVVVVCDTVAPVRGARTDGLFHIYSSFATYSCARGQHFFKEKQRRLNATCEADGRWWPDPHSLWCSDVKCDDFILVGSVRVRFSATMGGTAIFKCPSTTWFSPNVTELSSRCNENGIWEPDIQGRKCWTVDCGAPKLDHLVIPDTKFTYTSQLQLECTDGYYLVPDRASSPTIICDISGFWYPDPREYKCQGIECTLPRYIRHATISGNATFNSTVTVLCDPGFFISRGTHVINSTCLKDNTWSSNVHKLACIPFKCHRPKEVALSTRSQATEVPLPIYNSQVEYHCHRGYWISDLKYSRIVRCGEDGLWDPPINFSCVEIRCNFPPEKRNSLISLEKNKNQTNYAVGDVLRYLCQGSSWMSAQHVVTEWAFTGKLEVNVECKTTGRFNPHPDSFACREIEEGPLPVGYTRGLTDKQIEYESWLEEDPFLTPQLIEHPYLSAVPAGGASWVDGSDLASLVVRGDRSVAATHDAGKAWDGSLLTSWRPNVTEDRQYSLMVYLGGLYHIEGFEAFSGQSANSPDRIQNVILKFSPHGKWFNSTVSSGQGRAGRLVVNRQSAALSSKIAITDFNFAAKFVQVIISDTDNPAYPPFVREMKLLVTPAQWKVVYPTDFYTLPGFLLFIVVCFVSSAIYAHKHDTLDKFKVQFGWRVTDQEVLTKEDCYIISLTMDAPQRIKHLLCRVVGDTSCTASVLVDSPLKGNKLFLVLPSYCDNPVCFDIAVVETGRTAGLPPIVMQLKVGLLHSDQVRRRTTLHRLAAFDPVYRKFYHLFADHLLYTIFSKDFVSQTSRLDRLIVVFVGLMVSLAVCFLTSGMTTLSSLLTWYGVGALSSIASLPMLTCMMELLIREPSYSKSYANTSMEYRSWDWTSQPLDSKKDKKMEEEVEERREFDMDPRLEMVTKMFGRLCFQGLEGKRSTSSRLVASITDTADSCMLPGQYRVPLPDLSDSDASTVCTIDMQMAYDKRKKRRRRRTRSAPAIMQYKGRKRWAPGKVASYISLRDITERDDDDDRLSCASMWSNDSIVEQWHRVHTSVREPIDYLFAKCMPRDSTSPFTWHDPSYKRIPTTILQSGFRACVPVRNPDWLRRELEMRALFAPKEAYTEDLVPISYAQPVEHGTNATGTQFPAAYVLRGAKRMGSLARRIVGTFVPSRDTLSNIMPDSDTYRSMMPEALGGRPGPKRVDRKKWWKVPPSTKTGRPTPSQGTGEERYDDDTPHCSNVRDDAAIGHDIIADDTPTIDDVIRDDDLPSPGLETEMVLRNRARKKELVFPAFTRAATRDDDFEVLTPSAGAIFSKADYDDVSSDETSANQSVISTQVGLIKSAPPDRKVDKRKAPILIASPAAYFHRISSSRALMSIVFCACAIGCMGVVVLFGFSSVNKSYEVACLYFLSSLSYFIVTLSIEVVVRRYFQMKRERLALPVLRHTRASVEEKSKKDAKPDK